MGVLDGLDMLIYANINAIYPVSERNENIEETISSALSFLNLEFSVKSLYERLEKDREYQSQSEEIEYKGTSQKTFGIRTYNQLDAKATELLETVFTYLNAADEGTPAEADNLKALQKKAEVAYDKYRRINQDENIIKASDDFENAIKYVTQLGKRDKKLQAADIKLPPEAKELISINIMGFLAEANLVSIDSGLSKVSLYRKSIWDIDPILFHYCQQSAEDIKNISSAYLAFPNDLHKFISEKVEIHSKEILIKWENGLSYKKEIKKNFVNNRTQTDKPSPEEVVRQALKEAYMQILKGYIKIPVRPEPEKKAQKKSKE